jgi:hypothetical protein
MLRQNLATARLSTDSPELPLGFVTKQTILYSKM